MDSKERKVIAVCASWEDVENLNLVLYHMIQVTEGTDYLPMLVAFDRSSIESRGEESIREFLSVFEVENLAGFLLFGEMIRSDTINRQLIRFAHGRELPVFMLERQYEGCINLSLAYREGFERVARHIVEDHGCRNVVMVAGIRGNVYSEERIDLCRRILEEHGSALPQERILYGDFWDEPTTRALNAYFGAGGATPEAFVCCNDAMAIAVCIYLTERNIQVPDQVRVAGFDGILQGEYHEPTITTARPDYTGMFRKMLEKIEAWRPEESGRMEAWTVPFELTPRESCGCERADAFSTTKKIGMLKMLNLTYTRHIRSMGNFIRKTLSMNSLEKLADEIRPLFTMWQNPYCFAAVLDERDPEFARPLIHGVHGRFSSDDRFRWKGALVPDIEILKADPSVRIMLAQLLQNEEETMGYLVSGVNKWDLWEQERFEEQVLFLSAALNAVIGNHRLEQANEAILRVAEHDYLTGLYNRRGFLRELERRLQLSRAQGLTLTLFSMDMDGLKGINDRFGHHEGDHAIQCLARAIQSEMEGKGICARYGGDEFAFAVLAEDSFLPQLDAIRERIEEGAREVCGPREYRISASLGACSRPVRDLATLGQLLVEADRMLYSDKMRRKQPRGGLPGLES